MVNNRWLQRGLSGSLAVLALNYIFLSPALAQSGSYGPGHMGRWMMGGWGMGWFGMIFMLIFWGLVIVALVMLIRWLIQNTGGRSHSVARTGGQAMDILKARYAGGEITRDEFETMKRELLL